MHMLNRGCLCSKGHASKFFINNKPKLTRTAAGERLVEELAPELAPMLASLEMPANFVPATNAVLSEMARRGIGRQQMLTSLRHMGSDLPQESVDMIQVYLLLHAFPGCPPDCLSVCICLYVTVPVCLSVRVYLCLALGVCDHNPGMLFFFMSLL